VQSLMTFAQYHDFPPASTSFDGLPDGFVRAHHRTGTR
jgi:hypothetical protein